MKQADSKPTTVVALQDKFLADLKDKQLAASMYLVNGIRLLGQIKAFDIHTVLLVDHHGQQLVFKHAISTILPSEIKSLPQHEPGPPQITRKTRRTVG